MFRRLSSLSTRAPTAALLRSQVVASSGLTTSLPMTSSTSAMIAAAAVATGPTSSLSSAMRSYHQGGGTGQENMLEKRSAGGLSASPVAKELTDTTIVVVTDASGKEMKVNPLKHFAHMQHLLPDWLKAGIQSTGYAAPMPVQAYAIPLLMENWDVVGLAPTGTGKTVAFAVPSMATMKLEKPSFAQPGVAYPSTLVMCPTRELCQQTAVVFHVLGSRQCKVAEAYGGADRREQAAVIGKGCNVLVATPGRLLDFLEAGLVSLKNLDFFVMDEADRMLDMGFSKQIDKIQFSLDPKRPRRTMMWSATWHPSVQQVANTYLKPQYVKITAGDPTRSNKNIEQKFYQVREMTKVQNLMTLTKELWETYTKIIIFCARKATIEQLAEDLNERSGIQRGQVRALHGDMKQEKRDYVIQNFKAGKFSVMLATGVAGRGLDIPDLGHVINFDVPDGTEEYTHRIGRTGRAGRKGISHTFLSIDSKASAKFVNDLVPWLKDQDIPVPEEVISAQEALRNVRFAPSGRGRGRGGGRGGGRGFGGGGRGGGDYGGGGGDDFYGGGGGGGGGFGGGGGRGGGGYGGGRGGGGGGYGGGYGGGGGGDGGFGGGDGGAPQGW